VASNGVASTRVERRHANPGARSTTLLARVDGDDEVDATTTRAVRGGIVLLTLPSHL